MSARSKRRLKWWLALGLCLLLPLGVFGAASIGKKGSVRLGPVHNVTFFILDANPTDEACLQTIDAGPDGDCLTPYSFNHSVAEPEYTTVLIRKLSCWYEDNVVTGTDEFNTCVGYLQTDDTLTETASCVVWDNLGGPANSSIVDNVDEIIPLNAFGLYLRIKDVTDAGSQMRGVCQVEYSGRT